MKESDFNKNFMTEFKKQIKMWKFKVSGSEHQMTGVPDNLFCIEGKFLAIEFKIQRNRKVYLSPRQARQIMGIREDGDGLGLVIAHDEKTSEILINYISDIPLQLEKYIYIDWDVSFNNYSDAVEFVVRLVKVI